MTIVTLTVIVDEDKLNGSLKKELPNEFEFAKWAKDKSLKDKIHHQFHWLRGSGIIFKKVEEIHECK